MRTFVLLSVIAVSFLLGGMNGMAKTTKKSSKAKSTIRTTTAQPSVISASDFLQTFSQAGRDPNEWGVSRSEASKIMVTKEDSQIDDALIKNGFYKLYRSSSQQWNDVVDEMMDCNDAYFTKKVEGGKITVKESCGYWEIKFPTAAEKNKFLKTAEKIGFKYNSGWDAYMVPGTEDLYWISNYIFIDGNTVIIHEGGE